jgi:MFS transporter, ACS family, D-galactonate transporter
LIGGIFFAAYMLAQFPGGYAGDRHGHRSVINISLVWAAAATLCSGLSGALVAFIAARIITGLGEGIFYANDRSIIAATTPEKKLSFAFGVVITGLSMGITLATVGAPYMIDLGQSLLGRSDAWRIPFFILAGVTAIASVFIARELWRTRAPIDRPLLALAMVARYAAAFFVLLFGLFLANRLGVLQPWGLTLGELLLALGAIVFIFAAKSKEMNGAFSDPNLVLLCVSCIAVMWNLWFFGFWAVSIVSGNGANSFQSAALTAMFTGVAGLIGFPVGGWLADRTFASGAGRKRLLLTLTLLQGALILALALYIQTGGSTPAVMAPLLFFAGLFFSALQPVSHALVADIAPPQDRGGAFGLYTLIGEIGAVIRAEDDDDAIRIANDSPYGLSAAVFSRDVARALDLAGRIESGICHINGPTVHDEANMPFGGAKDSGYGRFGAKASVAEFTDLRWITVQKSHRHYPI